MLKSILHELEHHAPFTILGAVIGVALMFVFQALPHETTHGLFYVFHPAHVFLSAIATASMYQMHKCKQSAHKCNPWKLLAIGYLGSIGIGTLSDSVIPYWSELLLNMPHAEAHIGFVEKWGLIHPLAILGVAIAYFWPSTKISHTGHVFLSTIASLLHMMMAFEGSFSIGLAVATVFFLFVAVWVPCCLSDIVFPLLFIKESKE